MRSYSQAWPCAPLSPQTAALLPCGVRAVSLPSYQRAVVRPEWDVLLIQCLAPARDGSDGGCYVTAGFSGPWPSAAGVHMSFRVTELSRMFHAVAKLNLV